MPVADDDPDVEFVVAGELALLDPQVRGSRAAASALLDERFHEFGSSGTVWDRESILDSMLAGADPPPDVADMTATRLAADIILLTYRTRRPGRTTLRSSIWRRRQGRWAIYFHQGTVQPGGGC